MWDDIDLDAGVLRVRRAVQRRTWSHGCSPRRRKEPACGRLRGAECPQRRDGGLVLVEPKTRSSRRSVALPPPLVAELRAHRAAQLRLKLERANVWDHTHDLVFCTDWGALIDPHADYRDWKQILREAGVREVRLHDARHTAATLLLLQGVDIRTVMAIMGWTELATAQRYVHAVDELRHEAARRMGTALLGAPPRGSDRESSAARLTPAGSSTALDPYPLKGVDQRVGRRDQHRQVAVVDPPRLQADGELVQQPRPLESTRGADGHRHRRPVVLHHSLGPYRLHDAVTTVTAARPDAAARACSHARCRQVPEHHFGTRPRAGMFTSAPHQPHTTTCPGTLGAGRAPVVEECLEASADTAESGFITTSPPPSSPSSSSQRYNPTPECKRCVAMRSRKSRWGRRRRLGHAAMHGRVGVGAHELVRWGAEVVPGARRVGAVGGNAVRAMARN